MGMELELTPEQAVKNGAEWLDKVYPEWWGRVDVGTLSIENAKTCICGQLFAAENSCCTGFGVIDQLVNNVSGKDPSFSSPADWEEGHGFLGSDDVMNPLWVAEIKHRADIGLVD